MNTELIAGPGPIEGSKDKLVRDLKTVVDDANALLKEVADSSSEQFAAARTKVAAGLADARAKLVETQGLISGKACRAADCSLQYVTENPWKVVGLAAAGGLLVGLLLSRSPPPTQ